MRAARRLPLLLAILACCAALALCWVARRAPIGNYPLIYLDALASFMCAALLAGVALLLLAQPEREGAWRLLLGAALSCAGLLAAKPWLAALLLCVGAVAGSPLRLTRPAAAGRLPMPGPALPGGLALLLAFGTLTLRQVNRFDDASAGSALDSFVFWFALLTAAAPLIPARGPGDLRAAPLRAVWLYPLARLYTLGPWNEGWSLAAVLLGAAIALWSALAGLARPEAAERADAARRYFLALAVAALGLSTSAGVAAAGYTILTYAVLAVLPTPAAGQRGATQAPLSSWAVSGALPFTAPFVAAWMATSAAAAAGITALAAACWAAALLHALRSVLDARRVKHERQALRVAALASAILGIAAPAVLLALIQPVVDQLQGGLTPYGIFQVWPWVGLGAADAANRAVTSFPTIAVAALMLVLSAIVYLVARWRRLEPVGAQAQPGDEGAATLLEAVRAHVPWLGARPGASRERRDDAR
jgi:hypothetical protein